MKFIWILFFIPFCTGQLGQAKTTALVNIDIRMGFGGYVVPNRWIPIFVSADKNSGTLTIEKISQNIDGFYQPPEICYFNGGNRIESSFFSDENSSGILLRILDKGRLLSEKKLDPGGKSFPGHLILTYQVPSHLQQAIEQALFPEEEIIAVPVEIKDLPDNALNYDSVSGIIMTDPGRILSPRQIEALREWLSGGGHLIIDSVKPMPESIIPEIAPLDNLSVENNKMSIMIGWGSIIFFQTGLTDNPVYWRELFGLKPYQSAFRLTASKCFPFDLTVQAKENKTSVFRKSAFFFGLWAILSVLIIVIANKKNWKYLAFSTVIISIIVFFLSDYIGKDWQRGAKVYTRAVILPGSTGIILNLNIQAEPTDLMVFNKAGVSPWSINIKHGLNESGRIHPASKTEWLHKDGTSVYSLRRGNSDALNLTGYLPGISPPIDMNEAGPENLYRTENRPVLWKEKAFWSVEKDFDIKSGLQKITAPGWVQDEIPWLSWLSETFPDFDWIIGSGELPAIGLEIMGNINSKICWVMPVREENKR